MFLRKKSISHLGQPNKSVSPKMCPFSSNLIECLPEKYFMYFVSLKIKGLRRTLNYIFFAPFQINGYGYNALIHDNYTRIWKRAVRTGVTLNRN